MPDLTFLAVPRLLAKPDLEEKLRPSNRFSSWRIALAVALALAVAFPSHLGAQNTPSVRAQKIYAKLQRFSPQDEVEVKLRTKDRIQGRIASFDQIALHLDGQPNAIPLDDIANVKPYEPNSPAPAWNPATGFIRSWKSAAIVGGLLVGLIVLVATNTE